MSLHAGLREQWDRAALALKMARSFRRLAKSGLVTRDALRMHVPKPFRLEPYKAGVTTYAEDARIIAMNKATILGCTDEELAELIIIKLQELES